MDNKYSESMSKWYDKTMEAGYLNYEEHANILEKILKNRRNLLELGIGTGLLAERLVSKGYELIGIDFSPAMIKIAKDRLHDKVIISEQDVTKLSLKYRFDAAISDGGVWAIEIDKDGNPQIISHITDKNQNTEGLKKVWDHLKSGGLLILSVQEIGKHNELSLSDGAKYSQKIKHSHPWIEKEYFIEQDGKIVAYQKTKYRIFSADDTKKIMNEAGFYHVKTDQDKYYLTWKKK